MCQQHLDRYDKEGDAFLDRIITGDETWVHHYEPECKRQSMEWKHPQSPIRKKFKSQPSAGKLMRTDFWDSENPILEQYQETGSTINSARYSEMLIDRLKPAIRSKPQDNCRKALCCCMTMPVRILLPTQLKPSRNSSLRYWLTLRIIPISPLQTITCLVHSRRH